MNKRLHIYYSGSVQGIGFRYAVQGAACQLNLTGWVKNLRDGRVEAICEGDEAGLHRFLEKIKGIFDGYIKDVDMESLDATGEFQRFSVEF